MKSTVKTNCECGHEKRDHAIPLIGLQGYGECKICLCNRYAKVGQQVVTVAAKETTQI